MKIGILTLPLRSNYGGILQAFALQNVLQSMGHQVIIINRETKITTLSFPFSQIRDIKYYIKKLLGKPNYLLPSIATKRLIKNLQNFIAKHLHISRSLYSEQLFFSFIKEEKIDCIIVGSDQVWRPSYSPNIFNYFGDFGNNNIRKIAYAASLGVDSWLFNKQQTSKCKSLIQDFAAISVRESDGKELIRRNLGIEAELVLDPTLLLSSEHYSHYISPAKSTAENIFCYILDRNPIKSDIINCIREKLGIRSLNQFPIVPLSPEYICDLPHDFSLPSVEEWLSCFNNAKYIVTDSFHGMVFSIIFNKPFWVISNDARGKSRFTSLLRLLDLSDRIISDMQDLNTLNLNKPINWEKVNCTIAELRDHSLSFLQNNL